MRARYRAVNMLAYLKRRANDINRLTNHVSQVALRRHKSQVHQRDSSLPRHQQLAGTGESMGKIDDVCLDQCHRRPLEMDQ